MAKNNNLGDFLKGIADKFRTKLSVADPINPQSFEDKIDAVYDAAAQKAYNDFWDTFQQNGDRTTYEYAFAYVWTNEMFKPKYNINVKIGTHGNMFSYSKITGSLKTILEELGITLSFYQKTGGSSGISYLFVGAQFTELPVLDFSQAVGNIALQATFHSCRYLETIEKIILPTDCTGYGDRTFYFCKALKNIDFGGTIKYTLSFGDSPLSADSMKNIFDHLDTAENGETRTITVKTGTKAAYDEKYGDWDAKAAEFTAASWTIAIV